MVRSKIFTGEIHKKFLENIFFQYKGFNKFDILFELFIYNDGFTTCDYSNTNTCVHERSLEDLQSVVSSIDT